MKNLIKKALKIILTQITKISPKLSSKLHYYYVFHKKLNIKKPSTFNEKIQWLKLNIYPRDKLYTICADKYKVRDYVVDKGCREILNELIASYDSINEIDWDTLPNEFVIKCNHGAGYNIICQNKKNLDIHMAKELIKRWLNEDYWLKMAETHYKKIPKKIIIEKLIKNEKNQLPEDYKVYCFNGKPEFVMICCERNTGHPKYYFVDKNFNLLPFGSAYEKNPNIKLDKPLGFDELFIYAEKLCQDFIFVRADFYINDSNIIFGELTFTPAAGLDNKISNMLLPNGDAIMGEYLKLPKLPYHSKG